MTTIFLTGREDGIVVKGHRDTASKTWTQAIILGLPTVTFKMQDGKDLTVQTNAVESILETA